MFVIHTDCVGVCENTLRDYLRQYRDGGIENLKRLEFYQPSSELSKHRESLEVYFKEHPPASLPQAAAMIEQLTGILPQCQTGGGLSQKAGH
jgi:hypothetical protein